VERDNEVNCKGGVGGLVVAFLTGAGVAATAILLTAKARKGLTAESLLKKCDRAFDALDNQISHTATV